MISGFFESIVEDAALTWLEALGYAVLHGPDIAIGQPTAERSDPNGRDVVLEGRLLQALARLNPDLPAEAIEDAYRKFTRAEAPSLVERNRAAHRMLVDGVTVEYRRKDGSIAGAQAQIIDYSDPENNDWLAVNQFTVAEGQHTRRPDVVLFVNGLPLAVIELKNPVELLEKLLKGEIRTRSKHNVVQARSFAEMLEQSLRRYQNRAIETAKVIEELIQLAKEMRHANERGEALGLTEDEVAFYDALETNDSAVKVLGDDTLKAIARELVETIRRNVTIDWSIRENVRAQLRVYVKRILRKHGYPPDKQERAAQTVLEQAEVLSEAWAKP